MIDFLLLPEVYNHPEHTINCLETPQQLNSKSQETTLNILATNKQHFCKHLENLTDQTMYFSLNKILRQASINLSFKLVNVITGIIKCLHYSNTQITFLPSEHS